MRAEFGRREPRGKEAAKPKWQVRVVLHSASHTYSKRAARVWNDRVEWIKLVKVDNHPRDIAVEFTFGAGLHISGLWPAAWECSRGVAAALSIGAMGAIWFEVPKFTAKFYEQIRDLETPGEVGVEPRPKLEFRWHDGPLDERMMGHALNCMLLYFRSKDTPMMAAFEHYVQGLTLLGRSDLLLRLERNAFSEFFETLMSGLKALGTWDGNGDGREAFDSHVSKVMREEKDRIDYFDAGVSLSRHEDARMDVTLEQVGVMKVLCDMMFMERGKALVEELGREAGPGPEDGAAE